VTPTIALLHGNRLNVGGVESHLLSLMQAGDAGRFGWLVVSATSPAFDLRARTAGASVVSWQPAHGLDLHALARLLALLRTQRVDLIHVHSPRATFLGCLAARLLGVPVAVTVHIPSYYMVEGHSRRAELKRRAYCAAERLLNRGLVAQLIYVSARVYREARALRLVPRRARVIPNGVELDRFAGPDPRAAVRAELGTPSDAQVVIAVGRLDEQKGIDILLDALARVRDQAGELWLVGDGPRRTALEQQARYLGLAARVRFLGYRDDVPALLRASDLFALPSRYEAMSIAVVEALAAGLPCVVTDVGENRDLVEAGVTGSLVPPCHPEALAAVLAALLADPARARRMGQAARQRAAAFDVVQTVGRVQQIYRDLLGERCPGGPGDETRCP
jgi:glycosyltransferase involved in cell wall biosynthesis